MPFTNHTPNTLVESNPGNNNNSRLTTTSGSRELQSGYVLDDVLGTQIPRPTSGLSAFLDEPTPISDDVQDISRTPQNFSNPDFARLASVFPRYLHTAIRQQGDKADVSIEFPSSDCVLCLAILPSKVEHIATKLFELHVETDGPLRYFLSDKGRKSIPQPMLRQQGVEAISVPHFFGSLIDQGIQSSSIRRDEIGQGHFTLTACVDIQISNSSAECGYLNVTMGTDVGISVYNCLFQ
jgi:hypothetical protein